MLVALILGGQHIDGSDVLDRLVAELEILLKGDRVLDLEPDDRCGEEEGRGEETPLSIPLAISL